MPKGNNSYNSDKISLVGVKVPSFLTVTNSPIISSGTIEIDYNHTPLPISSGGTGLTSPGSKGQILSVISNDPEQLGWISGSGTGTVTSVSISVPSFLSVSPSTITSSGTFEISKGSDPIPISSGGTGLTTLGSANQILTVNEEGTNLVYKSIEPSTKSINLTTSTSFLSVVTDEEFQSIDCSIIPPTSGGTGLSTLGQPNQILAVNTEGTNLEYIENERGVTSVSMSVPSFLSVSPSTITSSGIFEISLSSDAIPISSGGTGLTSLGLPKQILSVNENGKNLEFTNPTNGTVTSISLSTSTPFLSTSTKEITSSGSLSVDCSIIPTSHGGTGLSEIGQANQILTSDGFSLLWKDLPLERYLTSIQTMFPLSYSDNTLSISSYTGLGRVVFENSPILITPSLGDASSSSLSLNGSESGSIKLSSKSGSYNFIFPTSIGQSSQILTSQGPFLPTTWSSTIGSGQIVKAPAFGNEGDILSVISTNPLELGWIPGSGTGTVTSVSMSVPSFLSVSPSTITASGSFEISLSSEAIPISSGGTGLTTLGFANQILSVNEEGTKLVYKNIDPSVKSISISTSTPFITVSPNPIISSGSLSVDCSTIPITHGGTGLTNLGLPNQILKVNSEGSALEYIQQEIGVTSISITVPPFLSVSPSSITSVGTFEISQGLEPIPISFGGTGLSKLGNPKQILSVSQNGQNLEFTTPTEGTVTAVGLLTSTPFLSISPLEITSSGSLTIDCSIIPISHGGTGLSKPGLQNQILTSNGASLEWSDAPKLDQYLTTINTIPPLQYSENTISISSFTGSGKIVFDTYATLTEPTLIEPVMNNVNIKGTQSGSIKLSAPAVSGNYNFILPQNYGKPFQVLTAQGPYNPSQWTSTTGTGDIVCSKNPILSGQTIFTNGTVLCKSKIIQSQGIVTITENTTLTMEELFSFLIIDSETEITITVPSLTEFNNFIGDYTIGNRISTLIQNKCPDLIINTLEGITLIDGRYSSAILVQELTYVMKNAAEGLLLLK